MWDPISKRRHFNSFYSSSLLEADLLMVFNAIPWLLFGWTVADPSSNIEEGV
jgi:hypothetical protein